MARYEHNTFIGQRIQVDGHEFIANRFENCILVYGGGPFVLRDNVLVNVQWQFIDSAARTVYLLSSFYQSDGPAKKFVELLLATFGKPVQTSPSASPTGSESPKVVEEEEEEDDTAQHRAGAAMAIEQMQRPEQTEPRR